MANTHTSPGEQPKESPIPVWLRVAQMACMLLALALTAGTIYQLVTEPSPVTGVWATLGIGAAGTWTALLSHGQQLRSAAMSLPTKYG